MAARRTYRQIADVDWTTKEEGTSRDLVAAASAHTAYKELKETNRLLREQNDTLRAILQQMYALGKDGLHEVIRFHRRDVKKANAARRKPRTTTE